MMTLPARQVGALLVYSDDADPSRYYVMPDRPRLARRPDGRLALQLLRWVLSSDAGPTAQARLTMDFDLRPTEAELSALRATLGNARFECPPWISGELELWGPELPPIVARPLVGEGLVTVVSEVSPVTASVLAPLLQHEGPSPLSVAWRGLVDVRTPGLEIRARVDERRLREQLVALGPGASRTAVRALVETQVRVDIVGTVSPAADQALRSAALDELASRASAGAPLALVVRADHVWRAPIGLQATLPNLVAEEDRAKLVERIVLGPDDLGLPRAVEVRALAPFGAVLEHVEVEARAGQGELHLLVLRDGAVHAWTPPAADGLAVSYRWRHKLRGHPAGDWTPWATTTRALGILIGDVVVEKVDLEIIAAGLDLREKWARVEVRLEHASPLDAREVVTVVLDDEHRRRSWSRAVSGDRGTLRANLVYRAASGVTVERGPLEVSAGQLVVDEPLELQRMVVTLLPVGTGWADIAGAMVDLRHDDGGWVTEETIPLDGADACPEWVVAVRAEAPRRVWWRVHASHTDGQFEQTPWVEVEAGVIPIRLDAPARFELRVLPIYLDASATPQVELVIRTGDGERRLRLPDRTPRVVTLASQRFSWSLTGTRASGATFSTPPLDHDSEVLVLPPIV